MSSDTENKEQTSEELSLADAAKHLLEECRMVLPGIQALFGFQLIAVFNQGFAEKLSPAEQKIHLGAIGLISLAVALVMAPASYHRCLGSRRVTEKFITIASLLLLWGMLPLALGTALDFYLIAHIVLHDYIMSALLAVVLLIVFFLLWVVLPRVAIQNSAEKKIVVVHDVSAQQSEASR